jgi:ASC-1-like (ASCH) protein
MLERSLENAQVRLLATTYDLSRDSRLAKEIVRHVNDVLDKEERREGIKRVKPGELLLHISRRFVILPIRTNEDIERAMGGERLENIRNDIVERCLSRYREIFPEAKPKQIKKILRVLILTDRVSRRKSADHGINGARRKRQYGPITGELARELVQDAEKAQNSRLSENPQLPCTKDAQSTIIHFLREEAQVPPAVREAMFLDLARLRARFYPRISMINSGQMPHVAMHVKAGRRLDQSTRYQLLAPVVVTMITSKEMNQLAQKSLWSYPELMDFHARRMARVLVEAYTQDGLLTHGELQWFFLKSTVAIGRILDWYQRKHNVILPCPGSVLDMGRMLTHKDIIVRLHLGGMNVLEISRQTYHAPKSIDAYLRVFDSVLILYLFDLPVELMARVMGRGISLVEEYIHLIKENLKEVELMRDYLQSRGIKLSKKIVNSGNCLDSKKELEITNQ